MTNPSHKLRKALKNIRWAFAIARSTCPRLFIAFGLNSAVMMIFPAGVALSLRGLINAASEMLSGTPVEQTAVYFWLIIGFFVTLGGSIGAALGRYFSHRFSTELRQRLQLDILRHHVSMPFARLEQQHYRDSLARAQSSPESHVTNLYAFSLDLATKAIQILSLLVILIVIEPLLFVYLLPIGIPYLIFQWRLSRRQFEDLDSRIHQQRWMGYYSGVLSSVEQAGEIKQNRLGEVLIGRWQQIMKEFRQLLIDYQHLEFIGNLIFAAFSVVAVYMALGHAIGKIAGGQLTIGDLAIFGGAAAQLRGLIEGSVLQSASLRWQLMAVERLREFFDIVPGQVRPGREAVGVLQGKVEFRDVQFSYPGTGNRVLHDLSFVIEPGESVALVGRNGAGKSTIAKLIAGFYRPDAGQILFDDRDAATLDYVQLEPQIACLFQQFGQYIASAADNIAFGDWQRLHDDRAAIEAIARRNNVHDYIESMPAGYDTVLGREFGDYQPSGGQWQQLAIARLMARDARILVLDEPTSNLDVFAEAELFKQFQALAEDRSTLLISHRFSTVSMADRILVIDHGQIVESGSHQELMEQNGHYSALFNLAQHFVKPS
jgi:ATP-binding cassette subfamily B protein